MNLWTDFGHKRALETESKPEIVRTHLHHKDMSNLVNYDNNSQRYIYTRLLRTKCPI